MARRSMVRRSSSFGRRSPGRLTEWLGDTFATAESSLAASSFIVLSSLAPAGAAKRPFTITRTVGSLFVASDQNAAVEFPAGAVGGLVVSDKAVALGATAIPDPVTQVTSDQWFMYENWAIDGSASTNVGRRVQRIDFDSRAQRKVVDGEDFVFVLANASAADGINFWFMVRTLVKLS